MQAIKKTGPQTMEIATFLGADHRKCDDAFITFENRISNADWQELRQLWPLFANKMDHHFKMEETVLFPAFESATGMLGGPTAVMRAEHEQMRMLFADMQAAMASHDLEQCRGLAETLMIMIQQHNMKEEQMLYPMADQHVDSPEIISRMQSVA
jgi:hemerythrin-like domain-containing protein